MAPEIIPRSESLKAHITVAVNHDLSSAKKTSGIFDARSDESSKLKRKSESY
jgi:hypothetical protein